MKLYWVSGIIQNNGNKLPWLLAYNQGELSLDRAKRQIETMRHNHNVLSAWIDTFDENDAKETVFHECYIDVFGYVTK